MSFQNFLCVLFVENVVLVLDRRCSLVFEPWARQRRRSESELSVSAFLRGRIRRSTPNQLLPSWFEHRCYIAFCWSLRPVLPKIIRHQQHQITSRVSIPAPGDRERASSGRKRKRAVNISRCWRVSALCTARLPLVDLWSHRKMHFNLRVPARRDP